MWTFKGRVNCGRESVVKKSKKDNLGRENTVEGGERVGVDIHETG